MIKRTLRVKKKKRTNGICKNVILKMFLVLISFCAAYDCIVLYSEFATSKTELAILSKIKKKLKMKLKKLILYSKTERVMK